MRLVAHWQLKSFQIPISLIKVYFSLWFHQFYSIFLELEDELENLLKSEEKDDIADLMNSCAINANIPSPGGAGDTTNVDLIEDNLPTDLL